MRGFRFITLFLDAVRTIVFVYLVYFLVTTFGS